TRVRLSNVNMIWSSASHEASGEGQPHSIGRPLLDWTKGRKAMPTRFQGMRPSRRSFLRGSAALGTALAGSTLFAPAVHAAKAIKLGYVSPRTGPLAAFAEADDFVVKGFLATVKDGLKIGSETYGVEVVVKDSQS